MAYIVRKLELLKQLEDTVEFNEIYPKYKPFIKYCLARIADLPDYQDIEQEVLLRIANKCDTIQNPQAVRSWLSRLIHNLISDHFRTKQAQPERINFDDDLLEYAENQLLVDNKTPEEISQVKEMFENLMITISDLEPIWREVLMLRELEGLSYNEIALKLGLGVGTIKSRLHRARQ